MLHKTKRLGQHFLVNKAALEKIAGALDLKPGETVIEIGAGHGELTERLAKAGARIIAIEKDKELAKYLANKFLNPKSEFLNNLKNQNPEIRIIEGDALKILPQLTQLTELTDRGYKLAGNIPYYITGRLLRIVSELDNKPALAVLTLQKEVAERICAKPPKMNLLAASVQFWAEPRIIGLIPKNDFRPAPKVDSAILKLTVNRQPSAVSQKAYYSFIKILFKQPRKTVYNNLRAGFPAEKIRKITARGALNMKLRPQNLSLEEIAALAGQFPENAPK